MNLSKEMLHQIQGVASDIECGIAIDWTLAPLVSGDEIDETFSNLGEHIYELCDNFISPLSLKMRAHLVLKLLGLLDNLNLVGISENTDQNNQLEFSF